MEDLNEIDFWIIFIIQLLKFIILKFSTFLSIAYKLKSLPDHNLLFDDLIGFSIILIDFL